MPQRDPPLTDHAAAAAKPTPAADPLPMLRRRLHARGLRFSLRARELPGQPDLVLPKRRSVILLRGCFWHGHGCALDRSAARFHAGSWAEKIDANQAHDAADRAALQAAGWQVETVWECELEQHDAIDRLAVVLLQR